MEGVDYAPSPTGGRGGGEPEKRACRALGWERFSEHEHPEAWGARLGGVVSERLEGHVPKVRTGRETMHDSPSSAAVIIP